MGAWAGGPGQACLWGVTPGGWSAPGDLAFTPGKRGNRHRDSAHRCVCLKPRPLPLSRETGKWEPAPHAFLPGETAPPSGRSDSDSRRGVSTRRRVCPLGQSYCVGTWSRAARTGPQGADARPWSSHQGPQLRKLAHRAILGGGGRGPQNQDRGLSPASGCSPRGSPHPFSLEAR